MSMTSIIISLLISFIATSCLPDDIKSENQKEGRQKLQDFRPIDQSLGERFSPPEGYQRIPEGEHSFAHYLRHLPLHGPNALITYYNGHLKDNNGVSAAVEVLSIYNKQVDTHHTL